MRCRNACKAAPYTHRITVQKPVDSPTRDTSGNNAELEDDDNWRTVATEWGAVLSRGGSERFASDQWQAGHAHEVQLPAKDVTDLIDPTYRFRFTHRGRTRTLYVISAIEQDYSNERVICACSQTRT